MTAFSPGQSPPPVSTPIRIGALRYGKRDSGSALKALAVLVRGGDPAQDDLEDDRDQQDPEEDQAGDATALAEPGVDDRRDRERYESPDGDEHGANPIQRGRRVPRRGTRRP